MAVNNGVISHNVSVANLQAVFQTSARGTGALCKHGSINMWAKFKPVRWASLEPPSLTMRRQLGYGLTAGQNKPDEPNFSWNSPFFTYNRPRGKAVTPIEPYRLGDFLNTDNIEGAGYNHNAKCSIVDDREKQRLTYEKVFEIKSPKMNNGAERTFDCADIVNSGGDVEIPITDFNAQVTANSLVGLFFYDVNTGAKFYNAYNIQWSDIQNGDCDLPEISEILPTQNFRDPKLHTQSNYAEGDETELDIDNGDTIHVYYCCVPTNFYNGLRQASQARNDWGDGSTQSETYWRDIFLENDALYFVTENIDTIQVVAPTQYNGHGVIKLKKFDSSDANHVYLFEHKTASQLVSSNDLYLALYKGTNGITFNRLDIPLSSPYITELSSNYSTNTVSPTITLKVQATCEGQFLINKTVKKNFNRDTYQVQEGTASNNINVVVSNNTVVSVPDDSGTTVELKVWGVGSSNRLLIHGTATVTSGGVVSWYFEQV